MKTNSIIMLTGALFFASCTTQKMNNSLNYPETKKSGTF